MFPKVSVIIPVYNVEMYLRECLISVVQQSLKDIEIICVNDASTDNSLNILEEFRQLDSRITILNQETNQGLSVVRNIGAAHATGKYLYFLDSDDFIASDAMEKLYQQAEIAQADIVVFNTDPFYEDESIQRKWMRYAQYYSRSKDYSGIHTGKQLLIRFLDDNTYVPTAWLYFFNTQFYKANNLSFIEGILYEDLPLTFTSMLKANKVIYYGAKLHFRRFRAHSIVTGQKTFAHAYGLFKGFWVINTALHNDFFTESEKRSLLKLAFRRLRSCRNVYMQLEQLETEKYKQLSLSEIILFEELVIKFALIKKENIAYSHKIKKINATPIIKLKTSEKEINNIKNGWSFRIGRAITYLPRKIRYIITQSKKRSGSLCKKIN